MPPLLLDAFMLSERQILVSFLFFQSPDYDAARNQIFERLRNVLYNLSVAYILMI